MPVEISKHLLAALQPSISEDNHGEGLLSQLRTLLQSLLDSGSSVLAVIDDKSSRHGKQQASDVSGAGRAAERLKHDLPIHRGGYRGKDVIAVVVNQVAGDLR